MNENFVYIQGQVTCALIEMEGMKAENQQRLIEGKSLAYTEKQFNSLIEKYCISHNAVLSLMYP